MRVHLIAVGTRMPDWVKRGFQEYTRRLPSQFALVLHEIPVGTSKGTRAVEEEGARILSRLPAAAVVVALDVQGQGWSTEQLTERLEGWQRQGRDVALVVGGPDGLSAQVLERSEARWSLGPLTYPHALVRVILAEQIYRAWTILNRHPYHRP